MGKTFEDQVLAFIKRGKGVTNKDVREHFYPDAETYMPDVDKALQKLSKKGVIKYADRQWVSGALKTCPKCKGRGLI